MFLGRQSELSKLNQLYTSHQFEMPVIYGRRRIGKTSLINEFVKDKPTIFFTGVESTEKTNLAQFAVAIDAYLKPLTPTILESFQQGLEIIEKVIEKENQPFVFVIDEYPYLAEAINGTSSLLQTFIDHHFSRFPNLMLILSGSSMSFMAHQVLGQKSPLYGRRTAKFKLLPFTVRQARAFLPKMNLEDYLTIYGITSGVPFYLSAFDDKLSLKDNMIQNIYDKNSRLFGEPNNLLLQEVKTPARYKDIIQAIATGASRHHEIATKTGIESGALTSYLKNLIELEIIEKVLPLGEKSNKKATYRIKDGIYQFWFEFIAPMLQLIEQEKYDLVYQLTEHKLPKFTSFVFETFCKQWLLEFNGTDKVKTIIQEIGVWYGNNPFLREKKQEEIDILAFGYQKDEMLIAECKWRNEATGLEVLEKLVARSQFFPKPAKELWLFSKNGYTERVISQAEQQDSVHLITYDEMFED